MWRCCTVCAGILRPLSTALQAADCDLLKAHEDARATSTMVFWRTCAMEKSTQRCIDERLLLQKHLKSRHRNHAQLVAKNRRANAGPTDINIKDYWRINHFLPFLDHMVQHLNDRFPKQLMHAMLSWYLVPANVSAMTDGHVDLLKSECDAHLPSQMTFHQEMHRWCALCDSQDNRNITSVEGALRMALLTSGLFPNTETVLLVLLSLPVGSCCCERSFSAMRRLKTWQRSSMGNI